MRVLCSTLSADAHLQLSLVVSLGLWEGSVTLNGRMFTFFYVSWESGNDMFPSVHVKFHCSFLTLITSKMCHFVFVQQTIQTESNQLATRWWCRLIPAFYLLTNLCHSVWEWFQPVSVRLQQFGDRLPPTKRPVVSTQALGDKLVTPTTCNLLSNAKKFNAIPRQPFFPCFKEGTILFFLWCNQAIRKAMALLNNTR